MRKIIYHLCIINEYHNSWIEMQSRNIVLCIVVGFVIASFTICSCAGIPESCKSIKDSKNVVTEGFRKISDIADAAAVNYHKI